MTSLQPDGSWSIPENLGDSVNTKFEEMAPFIHPDNQTLYFASRGHPGLGGLDLYQTKKDSSGRWKTPVNLGYPLNTCADEITLLVNTKGDLAYISSDKLGGKGRQDIYSFVLYPAVRPIPCTYFKGKVFDAQTRRKLEARFILTDLNKQQVVAESFSDPSTGEFLLVLPTDRNYALNVSCKGYLFYSEHFALSGIHSIDRPFLKDIPLKPIRIGESVILKNIFFDTDRYELKPTSISELTKLLELLQKNPNLKVEISGHTDNQGSAEYNIVLSQNRARAVFDYLTSNGISPSRLTFSGYGLSRPIDSNDTPEGRANNRRTEFRVTGL
jgi:outer membrane protein OmpA-like peptidoglycan-associated protein